MATPSASPSRDSTSPGGTPFICYHRLFDYPTEVSCSPPTPRPSCHGHTPLDCWVQPEWNAMAAEARPTQLLTPKASRVGSTQLQAALSTPQVMKEELQLRAALDTELSIMKMDPFRHITPDVTPLMDGLYVGGFPDEEILEILKREGIDVIVNCCARELDTRVVLPTGFVVHDFYAEDCSDYLIIFHCYDRFAEIVTDALRNGHRVYVHCVAGVNRSVTLCIAYLMQYYHMGPISCVQLFRSRGRVNILKNVSFRHQLVDFYLNNLHA
ncbi:kinetoplastid-specific dual specificity phosphatase, putative [Trypanosoma equiperdum]|uniref:protein-tyrosine-phosphatase n=2 Tax=Trypanozoon TaxID=39700 RepID=A0A1G4HZT6_TRYEQ|nr:kinetoplastid-specific dual specificity phosphatase [Trypanosoma brucei equiperdum]SCU64856.1 kinetoplastid-specific dual specificity phosphatase, putative [Trypanosoma equiperdum]